mmetsp:Transcript_12777/g.21595  ORF Transcript_12777/g.21595 Transcript_12777/m.21595 type:complete len:329 (+) Transcript_12777:166-1152(+)
MFYSVSKIIRNYSSSDVGKKRGMKIGKVVMIVYCCRLVIILMEVVDLAVLSDIHTKYDSAVINDYCGYSGSIQVFSYYFENTMVVMLTRTLLLQVLDPTTNQQLTGIISILTSALVSVIFLSVQAQYFGIGLCKPIQCWVINDESKVVDDVLQCWMICLVPLSIYYFHQLMQFKDGLISQILKPYVDRYNIYTGVCMISIMFEVYCHAMKAFVTDFRNSREARYMNLILNLFALLFLTFSIIIELTQSMSQGIYEHTIGHLVLLFQGCRRNKDNEFHKAEPEQDSESKVNQSLIEFSQHFSKNEINDESILILASNVNMINMILLSMT